ncbi:MAG: amidohydrolase [Candidatus Heimdallarchaeota archaeon]
MEGVININKLLISSVFLIFIILSVPINLRTTIIQSIYPFQLTNSSNVSGQVFNPDLIITDGTIITMEPDGLSYTSLAVKGDLISEVTNDTLTDAVYDDQTKTILLGGRTILPGFIDSHSHWIGDRDRIGLNVDEVINMALGYGWTTISEQFVNQERLSELISLDVEDRLKLRVNAYLPINYQEQRFGEWYQAYQPNEEVSDKVRIAGVKLFMDNGPYFSNVERNHWFTPEELNPIVKTANDLGFQISIHSFIDNATDTALNAIEEAQGDNSQRQYRHRIEHASFLRDDQLLRLDQMNVIVSAQLLWYSSDWAEDIITDTAGDPTPDLLTLIARWRDAINQGLTFIGSTDTPWGLSEDLGNAIKALYTVTTRIGEEDLIPPQWMLDQRITIKEALMSITIDGAYGTFQEDEKGSIRENKLADFVVLSGNPLEMQPEDLLDLSVAMTIVGGEVVYCAEGLEAMCDGTYQIDQSTNSDSTTSSTNVAISTYFPYLLIFVILKRKIALGIDRRK